MAITILKKDSGSVKMVETFRSVKQNKTSVDLSLFVGKVKLEKDAVVIQRELRDGK